MAAKMVQYAVPNVAMPTEMVLRFPDPARHAGRTLAAAQANLQAGAFDQALAGGLAARAAHVRLGPGRRRPEVWAHGVSGLSADAKKCVLGRWSRWPPRNRSTFSL